MATDEHVEVERKYDVDAGVELPDLRVIRGRSSVSLRRLRWS